MVGRALFVSRLIELNIPFIFPWFTQVCIFFLHLLSFPCVEYFFKGTALKAQDGFQEVSSRLTINSSLIEAAAVIWQLEFALSLRLVLMNSLMQCNMFTMIKPATLRELLKNVTLVLPEGCELIVGFCPNNVYLYYEVIQATLLADVHSFKLVLNITHAYFE